MQVKGLECATFNAYHISKLTYCSTLSNTKTENKTNSYITSSFVGNMIVFSICYKPFTPIGLPSRRVKSR
jgi:hypothetical protein